MSVRIIPLNTGYITLDKGVYLTGGHDYGVEVEVPCNAFYVEADHKKILVDTGMAATKEADWHHPGSYQPDGYRIDQRLAELAVSPDEIDTVIFTHMHWDHCANMKLFRNAEYWVHEDELAFALDPHVLYYKSYNSEKLGAELRSREPSSMRWRGNTLSVPVLPCSPLPAIVPATSRWRSGPSRGSS